MQRSGYVAELEAEHTVEAEGRIENLAELVGAARDFESIDEFLEQISLVADTDEIDDDDSSVMLMTLHSAKGLEYPVVFLIGLEDGVFPHMRSIGEPDELEEERRLAYVGITRARERLYLTHAWGRIAVRRHAVQPAEPLPRRDPRGPRAVGRGQPPRLASLGRLGLRRLRLGFGLATEPVAVAPPAATAATAGAPPVVARRTTTGRARSSGSGGRSHRDEVVEAALKPTRPAPSGADAIGLRVGDDVHHAKFGEGVITAIEGVGRQGRGRRALRRHRREAPAARLGAAAEALISGPGAVLARSARDVVPVRDLGPWRWDFHVS